jgi:hypothetical protein
MPRYATWIAKGAALVVVVLLGTFVAIGVSIGAGVRDASAASVAAYGGDRVDALMSVVNSPARPLRERNRAVWALGQLGDPRALPVLERHVTRQPCDHAQSLCQHELSKAIRLCRGGRNISAFLWR